MAVRVVSVYIDYKSPYAYLVKDRAWELEREFDVRLDWLHYTLEIPEFLGTVEGRNAHQWRRIRYSYMDARRLANRRGLTVRGPQKIFDSSIAAIGMLYAERHDVFRKYNDLVFERFWKRALDIEDREAIQAVVSEAGAPVAGFFDFLDGDGRIAHDRICRQAEEIGVFGVPTFVVDGEIFWGGDRLWMVREKLVDRADPVRRLEIFDENARRRAFRRPHERRGGKSSGAQGDHIRQGRRGDADCRPARRAQCAQPRRAGGYRARAGRGPPRFRRARTDRNRRGRPRLRRGRGYRRDVRDGSRRGTGVLAYGPSRDAKFRRPADPGHRRGQWLRARRRIGAGDGVRPDNRQREGALRPARDKSRAHSGLRRHAATAASNRPRPRPRVRDDRRHVRRKNGAGARVGEPGGRARRIDADRAQACRAAGLEVGRRTAAGQGRAARVVHDGGRRRVAVRAGGLWTDFRQRGPGRGHTRVRAETRPQVAAQIGRSGPHNSCE